MSLKARRLSKRCRVLLERVCMRTMPFMYLAKMLRIWGAVQSAPRADCLISMQTGLSIRLSPRMAFADWLPDPRSRAWDRSSRRLEELRVGKGGVGPGRYRW